MSTIKSTVAFCILTLLLASATPMPGAPPKQVETDLVSQAFAARMDGEYGTAAQTLEQELKKNPDNARAWFELARLKFQMFGKSHDLDASQEAIGKAVVAAPETAVYHFCASLVAGYNGITKAHDKDQEAVAKQFKIAIEAGEKALALNPDLHPARKLLVSLYGNSPPDLGGDKDLAEKHIAELEQRSPVDGAAARCEFSLRDDQDKRLALWQELGGNLDDDPRLHQHLALEFARAGDTKNARMQAERALELDPENGKVLMDLARSFGLKKEFDAAKDFARRYLAHKPAGPLAYRAWTTFALAKIQQMSGDKESAEKLRKQAQELDSCCWLTMMPPPAEMFDPPPPVAP